MAAVVTAAGSGPGGRTVVVPVVAVIVAIVPAVMVMMTGGRTMGMTVMVVVVRNRAKARGGENHQATRGDAAQRGKEGGGHVFSRRG